MLLRFMNGRGLFFLATMLQLLLMLSVTATRERASELLMVCRTLALALAVFILIPQIVTCYVSVASLSVADVTRLPLRLLLTRPARQGLSKKLLMEDLYLNLVRLGKTLILLMLKTSRGQTILVRLLFMESRLMHRRVGLRRLSLG